MNVAAPASAESNQFSTNFDADATVSIVFSVFISGSGAGFMQAPPNVGESGIGQGDDFAVEGLQFGPFTQTCANGGPCNMYEKTIPITPGTTFDFTDTVTTGALYDPDPGYGPAAAQFQFSGTFSFFGADGVTPVDLTEVATAPEPAEFGLLAIGFMAIAARPLKKFLLR